MWDFFYQLSHFFKYFYIFLFIITNFKNSENQGISLSELDDDVLS